ncbi:MAG TPA: glycine--tRNA ligase [Chloroflexota bacterium]|nr:glycine--tRNA ligase [Chloroflexota bacterium]
MDKIVSLCKRRGFVFPSSEIYGGFSSTWDYGPLGSLLKNNVKNAWIRSVVQERDDMVLLDAAILMHPQVWQASGHLDNFTDPLVDCKSCKQRFRADQVEGDRCSACGGELTEARQFNMMFKTFVGPVEEDADVAYLRPETAQGIFANFKNVATATRRKLPFGIAQVGKAFRNEITPGNFTFRTREFEQMEIEYFVAPGTDDEWHKHWVDARLDWYRRLGMNMENLKLREHERSELAHYAKATVDIEYLFPFGWSELEGIANRTDFDLRQHQEHSGEDLTYFDDQNNNRFLPYVIEPSAGADRSTLAFLVDAYVEEPDKDETRVVLKLHRELAPIKVAFLPLSKKPVLAELTRKAQKLVSPLLMTQYDDTQSIGRRYRRQDEIGTPYCITVDFQSLEDDAATIRERDSMGQVRVPIAELPQWFAQAFSRG